MNVTRLGSIAGWLALAGIFGYHLTLQALVGERVSGTTDAAAIRDYYSRDIIALLSMEGFLVIPVFVVFAFSVRETLGRSEAARSAASLGLLFFVIEAAVLIGHIAMQAAIVAAVAAGEPVVGLFRFWDVLYNSGAYVLEASAVASFGIACRGAAGFARWLPAYSLVLAGLLLINASAIWLRIPDAATLPANVLLGVWFGAMSVGLSRRAGVTERRTLAPQPA